MQSRLSEIQTLEAEVLAISADTPEENHQLRHSANLDFRLLSDADGQAMDAFGLRHEGGGVYGEDIARPGVFILNRDGQIVWRLLTDNWRVRVRPETVIEQLKQVP